jgi:hypothetical protein
LQNRQDSKLFTIIAVSAAANAAATLAAAATEKAAAAAAESVPEETDNSTDNRKVSIDKFQSLKKQIFSLQNFDPKTGICNQLTRN